MIQKKKKLLIGKAAEASTEDGHDFEVEANNASSEVSERRIRLSCDIPESKHRKIKIFAAEQGMTVLEVVEMLIDRYCVSNRNQTKGDMT